MTLGERCSKGNLGKKIADRGQIADFVQIVIETRLPNRGIITVPKCD
jgi:hypothetical protein